MQKGANNESIEKRDVNWNRPLISSLRWMPHKTLEAVSLNLNFPENPIQEQEKPFLLRGAGRTILSQTESRTIPLNNNGISVVNLLNTIANVPEIPKDTYLTLDELFGLDPRNDPRRTYENLQRCCEDTVLLLGGMGIRLFNKTSIRGSTKLHWLVRSDLEFAAYTGAKSSEKPPELPTQETTKPTAYSRNAKIIPVERKTVEPKITTSAIPKATKPQKKESVAATPKPTELPKTKINITEELSEKSILGREITKMIDKSRLNDMHKMQFFFLCEALTRLPAAEQSLPVILAEINQNPNRRMTMEMLLQLCMAIHPLLEVEIDMSTNRVGRYIKFVTVQGKPHLLWVKPENRPPLVYCQP